MWGPKAEELLATTSAPIWVVTEAHLMGHRFHDLKARMLRKGWDLYRAHATPNTKSAPGAAARELGTDPGKATTGGVLVAARRWLGTTAMCPITRDGVPGFAGPVGNNCSFMSWRTAGLIISIGGIYLEPGLGPQGGNLESLAEVATFLTQLATPFVLAGDFDMEPSELMTPVGSQAQSADRVARCPLHLLRGAGLLCGLQGAASCPASHHLQ